MRPLLSLTSSVGLSEWIVCPSSPQHEECISQLQQVAGLRSWSIESPLAAASFALGRIRATEYPIVLLLAMGDAAVLAPLIAELSRMKRSALILLTGDTTSGSLEYPLLTTDQLDETSLAAAMQQAQPVLVQLSEEEISTYLAAGAPKKLRAAEPMAEPRFRGSLVDLSTLLRFRYHEGIVLALGQLEPSEIQPVLWLAETLRVPTVIDACSGLREELDNIRLSHPSLLLEQSLPYHLIRVGDFSHETPEQHGLWLQVAAHGGGELFDISRTGRSPLCEKSTLVIGELEQVMKALGDVPQIGDVLTILPSSRQREARLEERVLSSPEGEEARLYTLSQYASLAQSVTLADQCALAEWNEHAQHLSPMHRVFATQQSEGICPLAEYLALSLDDAYSFYFCSERVADLSWISQVPALLGQLPQAHRVMVVADAATGAEPLRELNLARSLQLHSIDDLDAVNDFSEGEAGLLLLSYSSSDEIA